MNQKSTCSVDLLCFFFNPVLKYEVTNKKFFDHTIGKKRIGISRITSLQKIDNSKQKSNQRQSSNFSQKRRRKFCRAQHR